MAEVCSVSSPPKPSKHAPPAARTDARSRPRPIIVGEDAAEKYKHIVEQKRAQQRRHYQRKKAQLAEALERAKMGEPLQIPEYFERHRRVALERYNTVVKPRCEETKALKKELEAQWDLEHGNPHETKAAWVKQQLALRISPKADSKNTAITVGVDSESPTEST